MVEMDCQVGMVKMEKEETGVFRVHQGLLPQTVVECSTLAGGE